MRMHEILGVEPYERFEVKGRTGEFMLDSSGAVRYGENMDFSAYSEFSALLVNHPEYIIRKPRLSAEQIEALKAAHKLFKVNWLFYDYVSDLVFVARKKPKRNGETRPRYTPDALWVEVGLSKTLTDLASSTEPLDIVQALKDAGVEV